MPEAENPICIDDKWWQPQNNFKLLKIIRNWSDMIIADDLAEFQVNLPSFTVILGNLGKNIQGTRTRDTFWNEMRAKENQAWNGYITSLYGLLGWINF